MPPARVALQPAQRVLEGHRDWVSALALSPNGAIIASGDEANQVVLWDRATGKEIRRWPLKGWAYAMAFAPDGKHLLITERVRVVFSKESHQGVRLWDVEAGKELRDLSATFKVEIAAAAFSPDGQLLALGQGGECSGNGKVFIVDVATGRTVRELPGHLSGLTDLLYTADERFLLSAGRDTMVRVWAADSDKKVAELGKPRGGQFKDWIHAIALSTDQHWLAAADMAGQVLVYAL